MIFTRQLIHEFLDISDVPTAEIYQKLNAIGLEVDSIRTLKMPERVVVGQVLDCQPHPDADKLSVTQVDVGSEPLQIVCGAKNVAKGQWVPVAVEGAELPGGLVIKRTALRGVESCGMICASEELGLPKMGDGILVLDQSLGELKPGQPLSSYPILNSEVFEIDLTPNRGDCLCLLGICRELAVSFDRHLKKGEMIADEETVLGIGRVLQLSYEGKIDASLIYKSFETAMIHTPFAMRFILALKGTLSSEGLENFLEFTTYMTGVILQAYRHEDFIHRPHDEEKPALLCVKKDEMGIDAVYAGDKKVSQVGITQDEESKPGNSGRIIIEASYVLPDQISAKCMTNQLKYDDALFYRTSRGSNPMLQMGVDYFCQLLRQYTDSNIYSGIHELMHDSHTKNLSINTQKIAEQIGEEIDKSVIVMILRRLEFEVSVAPEDAIIVVKVPSFRHDIESEQDIVEEIVRIIGIDNITSKPSIFKEQCRINEGYRSYIQRRQLREKSAANGFHEAVHFLFAERKQMQEIGLPVLDEKFELLNPITNELDGLRTSLLPHLLASAQRNVNFGRKRIALFEVGSVYEGERRELQKVAYLHAGAQEDDRLGNAGKPKEMDFFTFAEKISKIIGEFEASPLNGETNQRGIQGLLHPFVSAQMMLRGECIGWIGKLHPTVQEQMDLPETFICELDEKALIQGKVVMQPYSMYQPSFRDLSLLVGADVSYVGIKKTIQALEEAEIKHFYPLDIYRSSELGDKISLTIRFQLQAENKTLTEEEIGNIMERVLYRLKEDMGAELR